METIFHLAGRWRERAADLEPYAPAAAVAFASCCADLEGAYLVDVDALLTPAQAAYESGYVTDTLRRMVKTGRLRDYGRPHAPLFRRGDLPAKRTSLLRGENPLHINGAATPTELARLVANRQGG